MWYEYASLKETAPDGLPNRCKQAIGNGHRRDIENSFELQGAKDARKATNA